MTPLIRWMPLILAGSLCITLFFELLAALLWGIRDRKNLVLVCFVNLLTNPIVVFLYYLIWFRTSWNLTLASVILECAAVLVEILMYRKHSKTIQMPILFGILANLFSFFGGEFVNRLMS